MTSERHFFSNKDEAERFRAQVAQSEKDKNLNVEVDAQKKKVADLEGRLNNIKTLSEGLSDEIVSGFEKGIDTLTRQISVEKNILKNLELRQKIALIREGGSLSDQQKRELASILNEPNVGDWLQIDVRKDLVRLVERGVAPKIEAPIGYSESAMVDAGKSLEGRSKDDKTLFELYREMASTKSQIDKGKIQVEIDNLTAKIKSRYPDFDTSLQAVESRHGRVDQVISPVKPPEVENNNEDGLAKDEDADSAVNPEPNPQENLNTEKSKEKRGQLAKQAIDFKDRYDALIKQGGSISPQLEQLSSEIDQMVELNKDVKELAEFTTFLSELKTKLKKKIEEEANKTQAKVDVGEDTDTPKTDKTDEAGDATKTDKVELKKEVIDNILNRIDAIGNETKALIDKQKSVPTLNDGDRKRLKELIYNLVSSNNSVEELTKQSSAEQTKDLNDKIQATGALFENFGIEWQSVVDKWAEVSMDKKEVVPKRWSFKKLFGGIRRMFTAVNDAASGHIEDTETTEAKQQEEITLEKNIYTSLDQIREQLRQRVDQREALSPVEKQKFENLLKKVLADEKEFISKGVSSKKIDKVAAEIEKVSKEAGFNSKNLREDFNTDRKISQLMDWLTVNLKFTNQDEKIYIPVDIEEEDLDEDEESADDTDGDASVAATESLPLDTKLVPEASKEEDFNFNDFTV